MQIQCSNVKETFIILLRMGEGSGDLDSHSFDVEDLKNCTVNHNMLQGILN